MMPSYVSILLSVAGILLLLRVKLHPGFGIFAGAIILALLVMPVNSFPHLILQSLWNYQTLQFIVVLTFAMTLSKLMEETGLLSNLATTLEMISPKLACHLIPAVIGLVPLPGGALVSAAACRDLVHRIGLNPVQGTFINYWFRHLWEFFMPVYPGVIALSVLLNIPLSYVMALFFPISIVTIITGYIISRRMLKDVANSTKRLSKGIVLDILRASWPVIILIIMIVAGLNTIIAFPLVVVLLAIQQRAGLPVLSKAFRYGFGPAVVFMLYAIMLYKTTIESSNVAYRFLVDMQAMSMPVLIVLTLLPFVIGFITGSSTAFVGIAFPLLVPFLVTGSQVNSYALLLAYMSGMLGLLLSPVHLCLVLSAEYFKVKLISVYRYIVPLYSVIEAMAIIVYVVFH